MAEIRKIVSHLHPLLIIYSRGPSPKSVSAYFWSRSKGHCGGAEICTISDNRSLHSRPADGDLILAYGVEGEGESVMSYETPSQWRTADGDGECILGHPKMDRTRSQSATLTHHQENFPLKLYSALQNSSPRG